MHACNSSEILICGFDRPFPLYTLFILISLYCSGGLNHLPYLLSISISMAVIKDFSTNYMKALGLNQVYMLLNLRNNYYIVLICSIGSTTGNNKSIFKIRVFTLYIIQAQCRDLLEQKPFFQNQSGISMDTENDSIPLLLSTVHVHWKTAGN